MCGAAGAVPHLFTSASNCLKPPAEANHSQHPSCEKRLPISPSPSAASRKPIPGWSGGPSTPQQAPECPIPSRFNGSAPVHDLIASPSCAVEPEGRTGGALEICPVVRVNPASASLHRFQTEIQTLQISPDAGPAPSLPSHRSALAKPSSEPDEPSNPQRHAEARHFRPACTSWLTRISKAP